MRARIVAIIAALVIGLASFAHAATDPFVEHAKAAVGLLYSQDEAGGMRMRCTVTAYEHVGDVYSFVTAAHCIGEDRKDKERSATPNNIPFFITFDETGVKRFFPAKVMWVGYQSRGEDFSVFHVESKEKWPTVPLGDFSKLVDGSAYWNIASPLGLGKQVQDGQIASLSLDRPLVEGSINWKGTLVLQQTGVNGGSSGSALISKDQHAIVGFLVGTVGGSTIIAIPLDRFIAVQKAVTAGKYKYFVREEDLNPDGSPKD